MLSLRSILSRNNDLVWCDKMLRKLSMTNKSIGHYQGCFDLQPSSSDYKPYLPNR